MDIQFALCLFSGFIETLITGVIYGWASLEWVLQEENYFGYLCKSTFDINNNNTNRFNTSQPNLNCDVQKANFNLIFTLSASFKFLMLMPFGLILDRFGTWVFRSIACSLFTVGFILLAVSTSATSWLLFPSMIFLGVSGIGLLVSNLQIANLSQNVKGIIITLLNGAYDSSAVVFFLVKIAYNFGFGFNHFFHILAWFTLLPWLRTFVLLPRRSIPRILPETTIKYGWKEWTYYKSESDNSINTEVNLPSLTQNSAVSPDSHESSNKTQTSFVSCLKTMLFWTNVFHFSVISFRVDFYLGTFLTWLQSFEDDENISHLTNVFGIIIFFGAACSPLNGFIIDGVVKYYKEKVQDEKILNLRGSFASMLTTSVLSILLSIAVIIPQTYMSFVLLLLTRVFVYGGNAAFIAVIFPTEHLGKLFGLTNLIAGLVSLLQYALFQIALAYDPTFLYINIGLLVFAVLSLVNPVCIFKNCFHGV